MIKVGDFCGTEVVIEITSVAEDEIKAKVISVDSFWSNPFRSKALFTVGLELVFYKPTIYWIIKDQKDLPWFLLRDDGKFEHYR